MAQCQYWDYNWVAFFCFVFFPSLFFQASALLIGIAYSAQALTVMFISAVRLTEAGLYSDQPSLFISGWQPLSSAIPMSG